MLFSVLAALLQASTPQPGQQPVRVWLDPAGAVAPGDPVRVYVALAQPGHLLALRVSAYGRIDVLFPRDPDEGTQVQAGTYELRPAADAPTFVAAEPEGTGIVLAALAPLPYRFDEFSRAGTWNNAALAASGSGADAQGALLDIVQRMQGDGHFNYDVVSYVVAQPRMADPVADAGTTSGYGYDYGPGYGGVTVVVVPVAWAFCDPAFWPCMPASCSGFSHSFGCAPNCALTFSCSAPPRNIAFDTRTRARPVTAPTTAAPIAPRPRYPVETPALRPPSPVRAGPERSEGERGTGGEVRTGTVGVTRAVPLARGKFVAPAPRRVPVNERRRVITPPRAVASSDAALQRTVPSPTMPVKVEWPRSETLRPVGDIGQTPAGMARTPGLERRTVSAQPQSSGRDRAAPRSAVPVPAQWPGPKVAARPAKGMAATSSATAGAPGTAVRRTPPASAPAPARAAAPAPRTTSKTPRR